ncbi:hypothetical protein ACIOWK_33920 [Pseudomonas protegens]|uniref:hypothetical protein n=1 Tax=Pseudomonas protegens TaxID=380021 RepID=UPI003812E348
MSIDPINIGGAPNDGNGQNLRSGGQIINDNFAELDTRTTAAQAKAEQGVANAAAARDAAAEAKAIADAAVPATALGDSVPQLINGVVPASQLPSFVDDVLEFPTLEDFPEAGETGKIYIAVNDGDSPTNPTRQYRWSGSAFVLIPSSPGSTDQVPEGPTNQYFTQSRVRSTSLSGLGALVNAAILATDTLLQAFAKVQGQLNAKLGKSEVATDSEKLAGQPAAFYTVQMVGATASTAGAKGLVPAPAAGEQLKFLGADGTYRIPEGPAEIVTNANGTATKFPDGTMICKYRDSARTAPTTAWGSTGLFITIGKGYMFPVAFVGALPAVTPSVDDPINQHCIGICTGAPTLSACSLGLISASSSGAGIITYIAVGRWK